MRHLRKPAGRRAEDQGVDHLPVIQFDYAYVSSGDARGQQVKMRTILDTSTGYGTACVIDVKGAGDKYATSSAVSFLKELGYTRFRCRTDPEPAIKSHVDTVIKCLANDSQRRQFPRVTRVWVPWKDGMVFCRDKSEPCGWTLKRDLGWLLTLRISVYLGS